MCVHNDVFSIPLEITDFHFFKFLRFERVTDNLL